MNAGSANSATARGTLYVVATPIGNLGDLSTRARDVLAGVTLVAAEDTRHSKQLLQMCGIETPLTSLHEHNESRKSEALIERLLAGDSIALICDAGTPLISDPGFDLVAVARARGVPVVVVPGPCAAIAALCVAGLPTDRFVFEGFLAARSSARKSQLETLLGENRTLVFYEAPHRLAEVLRDLRAVFGAERRAAVCRELTKRFESTYAGTLGELCNRVDSDADMSRGEIVIVVHGADRSAADAGAIDANALLRALAEELPLSQAARVAARISGLKRSDLYEQALRLARPAAADDE